MLNNQNIRILAKQQGVRLWEVAQRLQISQATMTRMLRTDLTAENQQRIITAINELGKEEKHEIG